ncbi:hypothetical protein Lfu02_78800 [Longispora fulva]|uniref:Uncharacterized protein n=1 Tax=Longispora fulva TaxID=619741 RepID=A0A8J7KMH0_9ACTN|nr:hypothetical protein [Longispora fulva]MBG6134007.1 hypothetical protein [Longispora fulva]GIG63508.1 hypothetical protein Lfu02_78800 [Longispora fulva]
MQIQPCAYDGATVDTVNGVVNWTVGSTDTRVYGELDMSVDNGPVLPVLQLRLPLRQRPHRRAPWIRTRPCASTVHGSAGSAQHFQTPQPPPLSTHNRRYGWCTKSVQTLNAALTAPGRRWVLDRSRRAIAATAASDRPE